MEPAPGSKQAQESGCTCLRYGDGEMEPPVFDDNCPIHSGHAQDTAPDTKHMALIVQLFCERCQSNESWSPEGLVLLMKNDDQMEVVYHELDEIQVRQLLEEAKKNL